ncbi:hypothetical protein Pan241w_11370 [Gimesia alba]|uniref:Uncharacterized protein n=1 Tax=Gimesia alba TaxID=2527973 RepID=A0A517RB29_9PLAN|nr:hypothetical protein [Gimesia alba]QDT41078.1 hypothetical protein Pan241w_11370 [Gimesia alba]
MKTHLDTALIDRRRELVSRYKSRGMTVREITDQLASVKHIDPVTGEEEPFWNPETGEPWTRGTVQNDINYIRQQWRERASENADEIFGEQLADLNEAIRAAWEQGDIGLVMRGLKDRRELLGLGSKTLKLEHSIDGEDLPPLLSMEALNIDQLATIVEAYRIAGPAADSSGVAGAPSSEQPTGDIIEVSGGSGAGAGPA